jgi:hypothetical protein
MVGDPAHESGKDAVFERGPEAFTDVDLFKPHRAGRKTEDEAFSHELAE